MLKAECEGANSDQGKREEEEQHRFSFIVGNYSVRRFLADVERDFGGGTAEASDEVPRGAAALKIGLRTKIFAGVGQAWRSTKLSCFSLKNRGSRKEKETSRTESQGSKRPMFGEISSPPRSVDAGIEKTDGVWMKGLLWYYGIQSHISASTPPSQGASTSQKSGRVDEKTRVKTRGCMTGLKHGVQHTGRRLRQVFFRKCTSPSAFSFQALDG